MTQPHAIWPDYGLVFNQVVAGHFPGLFETHDVEERGSDIGENAVFNFCVLVLGHIYKGYGIERVCGVGSSICILGMVGIAVVGDDNHFVAVCLGSLYSVVETDVESFHSFLYCGINAGMTHHVAVRVVDNDKVVFFGVDCADELIFYLECTHFGLEVVCGYFRRGYEYAVLAVERSLASAVEEECHVRLFLGLGDVELLLVL